MLHAYLQAGAKLDSGDYDKRTALHIAASEGIVEMVRRPSPLLRHPCLRDAVGTGVLHLKLPRGSLLLACTCTFRRGSWYRICLVLPPSP